MLWLGEFCVGFGSAVKFQPRRQQSKICDAGQTPASPVATVQTHTRTTPEYKKLCPKQRRAALVCWTLAHESCNTVTSVRQHASTPAHYQQYNCSTPAHYQQ